MGSYASLWVSDFEINCSKNHVYPIFMTIFSENDKKIINHYDDMNHEESKLYHYSNSVKNIIDRLEIMGFNLEKVENQFKMGIELILEQDYLEEDEREFFTVFDYKSWVNSMKSIVGQDFWYLYDHLDDVSDQNIKYVVKEHVEGYGRMFGVHEKVDFRYILRSILELFDPFEEVTLKYTELVNGGWCEENVKLCEEAFKTLAEEYITNEKIIILTEGSSDVAILKQTMFILYPHLYDYYSFMDFDVSNAGGSASNLVHYIKSFVGSGIRNRVIAIFDNDTAAEDAIGGLKKKTPIPSNIKVLQYPDIEIASNYPTLGPYGIIETNINGLACSIELYLGKNILQNDVYELTPVQWKGYNQKLNQYQGEILNKGELQQRYFALLKKIKNGDLRIRDTHDWSSMKKIFEVIFHAFD